MIQSPTYRFVHGIGNEHSTGAVKGDATRVASGSHNDFRVPVLAGCPDGHDVTVVQGGHHRPVRRIHCNAVDVMVELGERLHRRPSVTLLLQQTGLDLAEPSLSLLMECCLRRTYSLVPQAPLELPMDDRLFNRITQGDMKAFHGVLD